MDSLRWWWIISAILGYVGMLDFVIVFVFRCVVLLLHVLWCLSFPVMQRSDSGGSSWRVCGLRCRCWSMGFVVGVVLAWHCFDSRSLCLWVSLTYVWSGHYFVFSLSVVYSLLQGNISTKIDCFFFVQNWLFFKK